MLCIRNMYRIVVLSMPMTTITNGILYALAYKSWAYVINDNKRTIGNAKESQEEREKKNEKI